MQDSRRLRCTIDTGLGPWVPSFFPQVRLHLFPYRPRGQKRLRGGGIAAHLRDEAFQAAERLLVCERALLVRRDAVENLHVVQRVLRAYPTGN